MNSIFGRLPPPCAMNGFNYNPPPAMEFYNPEASLYGMFSCTINKTWKNLSFCCVFSCRFFMSLSGLSFHMAKWFYGQPFSPDGYCFLEKVYSVLCLLLKYSQLRNISTELNMTATSPSFNYFFFCPALLLKRD